ncbi:ParB/RepB/Spo0J family partition protein [Deinococcus wulumuqiensis]|uniref:ParB/RepB/Spo0J family partition protein n=1 Tax=Deinococcus wulumuqiensis TaxID=980427 RepID=UPI00242C4FCC|nr:ParB/RepB/Spo0J family partition protein [Deinococcus wulumuqiensis]
MTDDHFDRLLARAGGNAQPAGSVTVPLDRLQTGPFQPRRIFDTQELADLTASVKEKGVLQPLLVRPLPGLQYEIVAGERRWRAAQAAGLREVPVHIRQMSDQDARLFALIENLQRSDLSPFDEIEGKLHMAAAALGLSPEEARPRLLALVHTPEPEAVKRLEDLFRQIGRESWESYAKNKLRVFGWPEPILQAMREGLSFTVAGVIAAAPEGLQAELLALALQGVSRTELKDAIKRAQKPKKKVLTTPEQVRFVLGNRRKLAKVAPEKMERAEALMRELLELLGEG